MTLFAADWICPVSEPPIRGGAVRVDHGRIIEILPTAPSGEVTHAYPGCALIPGLVNAHIHLELTVMRGLLEGLSFAEWIRTLTRTKYERLTREDLAWSARLGVIECLRSGVTAVGEVMDIGTGWEAMIEFGIRGVAYQEVFGPSPEQADGALRTLQARVRQARESESATARVGVSPHAPYTVSADLYRQTVRYARDAGLPMAVHIAESDEEDQFVRDGTGPFAEHLTGRGIRVIGHGTSPLAYLDGLGVLGPSTQAIHAIRADGDDIARLARTRTSVVHCPKSNGKLGHRTAPLVELRSAGVPVGLGTDSVASNNTVDMFEEMRSAIFLQRSRNDVPGPLEAADVLRMATLDGARSIGMDAVIGSIEPGKRADFAVVDLSGAGVSPVYDPVDAIVYAAHRGDVAATIIDGRTVRPDGESAVAQVQKIADRLAVDEA